jgi:hypothetical protein
MTTVATCSNPAEAMLLKSMLEANNITAYVPDDAQTAPNFSGSGIRVQVDDEHADTAKRILEEAETSSPLPDDNDTDQNDDDRDQSR